ncbi:MAG: hypothetical protein ABF449_02895 [Ethanoligenens sp.]
MEIDDAIERHLLNQKIDLLEKAKAQFEECKKEWGDLPEYVYGEKYKQALLDWVKSHVDNGRKDVDYLVIMALHHETEDRVSYFKFTH